MTLRTCEEIVEQAARLFVFTKMGQASHLTYEKLTTNPRLESRRGALHHDRQHCVLQESGQHESRSMAAPPQVIPNHAALLSPTGSSKMSARVDAFGEACRTRDPPLVVLPDVARALSLRMLHFCS